MEIRTGVRLSKDETISLLNHFDDSSDRPLHEGLDFETYGRKLSEHACFVLVLEDGMQAGFAAYYLNEEGCFIYIPQIVVHSDFRHKGIGHMMMDSLCKEYVGKFNRINLEVLKDNRNARQFYDREGFTIADDHGERLFLTKRIKI